MPHAAPLASAAPSTQMNTRIDLALKRQGDAVLKRHGISPSQAVRALWGYLAEKDDLPPFMRERRQKESEREQEQIDRLVDNGKGLALRLAIEAGLIDTEQWEQRPIALLDHDALKNQMYEWKLDDYHACLG